MQALSQYAQQDAYRKEREKERQREDRNLLANTMAVDPVYATSIQLQGKMAEVLEEYQGWATEFEKSLSGKELTAGDLMKAQQMQAQTAAKIGQYKAWDTELQDAAEMVKKDTRGIYDSRKFAEAYKEMNETGVRPKEGYLFPAVKNPIDVYSDYAKSKRPEETVLKKEWVKNKDGSGYWDVTYGYVPPKGGEEDKLINSFGSSQSGQYYIQNWFDDPQHVNPVVREQKIKEAGGDVIAAANMWFQEEVAGMAYPTRKTILGGTSPKTPSSTASKTGVKEDGNAIRYNGKTMFTIQPNHSAGFGDKLAESLVFQNDWTYSKKGVAVPPDLFILPAGVVTKGDGNITAYPTAADKTTTYWKVSGKDLKTTKITKSEMEAWKEAGVDNYTENEDGTYSFLEDGEGMITLKTRTGDTRSMLNTITENTAGHYIDNLPGEAQEIPREEVKPKEEEPKEDITDKWSKYKRK